MSVREILEAVIEEDAYKVKKLFNEEVESRILSIIEEEKKETVKKIFNAKDVDGKEEDEDEDEDDLKEEVEKFLEKIESLHESGFDDHVIDAYVETIDENVVKRAAKAITGAPVKTAKLDYQAAAEALKRRKERKVQNR